LKATNLAFARYGQHLKRWRKGEWVAEEGLPESSARFLLDGVAAVI